MRAAMGAAYAPTSRTSASAFVRAAPSIRREKCSTYVPLFFGASMVNSAYPMCPGSTRCVIRIGIVLLAHVGEESQLSRDTPDTTKSFPFPGIHARFDVFLKPIV